MSKLTPRLFTFLINSLVTKKEKSIYGIKYTIELDGDANLSVKFSNPDNLSYNPEALFGYIENEISDFFKMTGVEFNHNTFKEAKSKLVYTMDGKPLMYGKYSTKIYLNNDDITDLNRVAKTISDFKYQTHESESFYSPVTVKFKNITMDGQETMKIYIDVLLIQPEYNGMLLHDNEEIGKIIADLYNNDYFYDYTRDGFPAQILDIIWGNPLLYDNEYMIMDTNLEFYTKNGVVNYWDYF